MVRPVSGFDDARKTAPSLESEFVLPCGLRLKNRLVKAAMSDSLGDGSGDPTDLQIELYRRWAQGGVGLSIIGEVQVDPGSSDQLDGGLTEDDSLVAVELIGRESVDLIDISGGTYFPGAPSSSDRRADGPYFR